MLRAVLGAGPRPFYFASPASFADRLGVGGVRPVVGVPWRRCSHRQTGTCVGGAASIWHVILPWSSSAGGIEILRRGRWRCGVPVREEGSWNAAWDVRPARWLHGPHSAWLLFGVCACCAPFDRQGVADLELVVTDHDYAAAPLSTDVVDEEVAAVAVAAGGGDDADYRVTGVAADGRCLFRAIVHGSCLSCRKEAPDETRQQELADDLRARVADELLKRREEIEQFIEEDFDTYLKNIRQPYTWGGEPELLMATHVLQAPISVFTKDRRSGGLEKIASYGQEYEKDGEVPIRVLFHGYGHYDVLETL